MEAILTPEEMSAADLRTQQEYGIPSLVLMERAALGAYEEIRKSVEDEKLSAALVVAGTGNNGGDALAVARLLIEDGFRPDVFICGNPEKGTDSFRAQKYSLEKFGCSFLTAIDKKYDLVVDGLIGISLNRDIEGTYRECVEAMNRQHENGAFSAALDIPSGIDSGDGSVRGIAVCADLTVTFGYRKVGQLLYPGARYCGRLVLKPIGIPPAALSANRIFALDDEEIRFPDRIAYSNKGTYGKLLLVAGSDDIAGAMILSAMSAMRSGLGMIRIITAERNRDIAAGIIPEAMVSTVSDPSGAGDVFSEALAWCDAIAIGPGIGRSDTAGELVRLSLSQSKVPVAADADALNIIAEDMEILTSHAARLVITPHLGEMARLTSMPVKTIAADIIDTASDFSKKYDLVTVLKDARTVIASPEGRVLINRKGNSGMATAGSGDVLTGMIGALLAGGMDIFDAAGLGCALHSKAGDVGASMLSERELLARDIIKYIGA